MHRTTFAAALALAFAAAPLGFASAQPSFPPPVTDPAQVPAGHYVIDPHHAALIMRVQHMGMTHSTFRMNKIDASFDYDPAKLDASKVSATIDANSFDQGDPAISTQFAKEFLDAPNHPQITFNSTSLKRTDATHGELTGDLTLAGVTKPVTLAVTFDGFRPASNFGPPRAGFSATGQVKRADFGVGKTMPAAVIGDVDVVLEIEFTKAK
jgi:polyisoprenoid-binding protein YceI